MMTQHPKNADAHGARSQARRSSGGWLLVIGDIPHRLQERFEDHPTAAFVVVGAASFVLGGLLGSKVGRVALAAGLPIVVRRVLEGRVGEEIARIVDGFLESPSSTRAAHA